MNTIAEHEVEEKSTARPGTVVAMDGTQAVVEMETAASEAAGAYPITPSTQMGEGWAVAAAEGRLNVNGRRLIFFEPEGEHAAAGVTAGMSMVGMRSANFSSGQGIAYMHESLYAAVGKRLTYVLNMACRAMTKHALNVHAGHDDYHAIDDTGFFQLFAKNAQVAADFNLIAHRIAELALTPGVCAQDGFLTSHVIETFRLPERDLIRQYLGDAADEIDSPTPAQRMVFGARRRRIPEMFDLDNPTMLGVVQNQDSYAQGVASQRPFFFDHVAGLADRAMREYAELSGRAYARTMGYQADDAEYLLVGQGSVVANAEALVDYLRRERGLKIGVVDVTMFRPFPADLVAELLAGKRRVTVLERVDQPLAVDQPLLREIRAAMAKAVENHRAAEGGKPTPHAGIPAVAPDRVPDFYSACYGLGSRDLQPGDLLAAVENMTDESRGRRQYYLGIEFVRDGNVPAALDAWQKQVLADYPRVKDLALKTEENVNLLPENSIALRIHSVGGWGAITMGKNLTMTLFDLLGMHVKSNPKYGSEKKGQPTTFYGVFAHEPIRVNCELKHVDVVLSPDPNVFRHSNPLDGLSEGGVFVVQADRPSREVWDSFPGWAQRSIREKNLRVFHLDGFGIARDETDQADLQYRMQGAAFQGAFFRASPVMKRESLEKDRLFEAIRDQLKKKFGHRGSTVVEDNFRVISRGFEEVQELDWAALADSPESGRKQKESKVPWYFGEQDVAVGAADPFRFQGQVCHLYQRGEDPIADPFSALSAIPAATGIFRDMTGIRFEVPEFIADHCTGCGQCWTQCPDAAIPGLVSEVDDVIRAAVYDAAPERKPSPRLVGLIEPLGAASRKLLKGDTFTSFASTLRRAYENVVTPMGLGDQERDELDLAFDATAARVAEMPIARTAPFFTVPERREEGSGGLLSITINPYACKGCNLCVEVCPDDALRTVKQDQTVIDKLKANWELWQRLPDSPDRFLQVSDMEHGIGVLHTLLLKKKNFLSMVGGDGSCMGCGEKTAVHLITAAIEASMQSRVAPFVATLDDLIKRVDQKAKGLLVTEADLDTVASTGSAHLDLAVGDEARVRLGRLAGVLRTLRDVRWRYETGPTGRGRAALGITNSTGCSSVWGSTYPYNPYPYPWTNHLFQDAPSVAIGIFEGVMRKMADAFGAVRKAELELDDAYEPAVHDKYFQAFDWREFSDDEFHLCPPILAIGGDGAMLDIGFQNVSRLMASGKPIRVVVLDTQVYSNTGGQACTSGFHGQVSDMAAYGAARHGKEEQRKEMGLIAMAHRNTFVLQTMQAHPAHLVAGVLRGLASRRPALFNVYTPCQAEHGLPDSGSANAAKLALESRAFPCFVFDPDAGDTLADKLDLEGNPALDAVWPAYELTYVDDDGAEKMMSVPLTVADWAATEPRFGRHFKKVPREKWTEALMPFADYVAADEAGRNGRTPYILMLDRDRRLTRLSVSPEMVELAEDRLEHWHELMEIAGESVPDKVAKRVTNPVKREYEKKLAAAKAEYEAKLAELKQRYPVEITRRIAEALVAGGAGFAAPTSMAVAPTPASRVQAVPVAGTAVAEPPPAPAAAKPAAAPAAKAEPAPAAADEGMDPFIDTELCTTCNECTNLNPKMFMYNADKKAYIADPHAGTFKQMVQAAERCTARIIHPGTPLDPDEPDLDALIARAKPFNQ